MGASDGSRSHTGRESTARQRAARGGGPRPWAPAAKLVLLVAGIALLVAATAPAVAKAADGDGPDAIPGAPPFSRLERPDGPGAVFLFGTAAAAAPQDAASLHLGWSVGLLLRPLAAGDLLEPLFELNTGLVMRAQGQGAGGGRELTSADLVLRRYLADRRRSVVGAAPFVGAGMGIARGEWPAGGGSVRRRWWSPVVEAGLEVAPAPDLVLMVLAQYRRFDHFGQDLSGWALHCGAGVPLFF